MSRRSNIRKRERKKRKYAQRRRQVEKPITHVVRTAALIADLTRPLSSRAFDEALQETQISPK